MPSLRRVPHVRTFTTTSPRSLASPLFALSSLSNSRETQHFNRLSSLPRTEHSPSLKLIQTGEILPHPLPTPPPPLSALELLSPEQKKASILSLYDDEALAVGRAVLVQNAAEAKGLRGEVEVLKGEVGRLHSELEKEREWGRKAGEMYDREMKTAAGLLVGAVGVATGLAVWRFWPQGNAGGSAEAVAEGVRRMKVVDAAVPVSTTTVRRTTPVAAAVEPALATPVAQLAAATQTSRSYGSWLKGFLWKQS